MKELKDEAVKENHNSQNYYPKMIPVMFSKEKLKCRKIPLGLQYRVLSKKRYREEYTNHILFMYLSFMAEEELKYNNSNSNKLNQPSVIELFTSSRSKVENYATIVEDGFVRLIVDRANIDPFEQQENDETCDQLNGELFSSNVETNDVETEI